MSFQPRRYRAIVASLAATLLVTIAVPAAPALGIALPVCRVRNVERATGFTSLQDAVSDAATVSGDHLTVKGLCDGDTAIAKDLSIRGIRPPGDITPSLYGTGSGSVVTIAPGARVSIASLTISGGDAADGGGIYNEGILTLTNVRVYDNHATAGGGGISSRGRLTLLGRTSIDHNSADVAGGGIDLTAEGRATVLVMKGRSSVHHDTAGQWGGGISAYATSSFTATVTLAGRASLHHDSSRTGGAYLGDATLTMRDSSRIHDSTATVGRGGIVDVERFTDATSTGSLTMRDGARIDANTAGADAAALVARTGCGATPVLVGVASRVTGNTPAEITTAADCP